MNYQKFYEHHDVFKQYSGLVLETSEGDEIAKLLTNKKALILQNHGLLTVGSFVESAAWWFITMERSCQAQLMASSVNGKDIIKSMVATADLSRSGFMNGDISTVMSPRTVLTWAENYLIFDDIEYAFKLSFLNRCDELERPIIEEYFQRSFGIDISDAKVANVKE